AVGSGQVNLSWSPATDNVGVTGYQLERCAGQVWLIFAQGAAPTGTSYSDTGVTPSTTYRYQVRAVDAAGNQGGYSGIATATTPGPPAPPPGLAGACGPHQGLC